MRQVCGIGFKIVPEGIRVMTQWRHVTHKSYDPIYDNTWEVMGETLEPGECIIYGLIRGCREGWGHPNFLPMKISGSDTEICWAKNGSGSVLTTPFCFIENLGPPQPWNGPVFLVQVHPEFEPNFTRADGEATKARWWEAQELLHEIETNPQIFNGWHAPALHKFVRDILTGKFSLAKSE